MQLALRVDQPFDIGHAENAEWRLNLRCFDNIEPRPIPLKHMLPEELQVIMIDFDGAPGTRLHEFGKMDIQFFDTELIRPTVMVCAHLAHRTDKQMVLSLTPLSLRALRRRRYSSS